MPKLPRDVKRHLKAQAPWARPLLKALITLMQEHAPEARLYLHLKQPCWEQDGLLCYALTAARHISFGFFKGAALKDPEGLLEGSGKGNRHIKLRPGKPLPEDQLVEWIKEAVEQASPPASGPWPAACATSPAVIQA